MFAVEFPDKKLECRRNPPAVSASFSGLNLAAKDDRWPAVSGGAWCGEWKKVTP